MVDDFLRSDLMCPSVTDIPEELQIPRDRPAGARPRAFASPSTRRSRGAEVGSRDGSSGAASDMIVARSPSGALPRSLARRRSPARRQASGSSADDLVGPPHPCRPRLARRRISSRSSRGRAPSTEANWQHFAFVLPEGLPRALEGTFVSFRWRVEARRPRCVGSDIASVPLLIQEPQTLPDRPRSRRARSGRGDCSSGSRSTMSAAAAAPARSSTSKGAPRTCRFQVRPVSRSWPAAHADSPPYHRRSCALPGSSSPPSQPPSRGSGLDFREGRRRVRRRRS